MDAMFDHLPALDMNMDDEWLRCLDLTTQGPHARSGNAGVASQLPQLAAAAAAVPQQPRYAPVPAMASQPRPINRGSRAGGEDPNSSLESTTTILGAVDEPEGSYRGAQYGGGLLVGSGSYHPSQPLSAPYHGVGGYGYGLFEGACLPPPPHAADAPIYPHHHQQQHHHQHRRQQQQQQFSLVDLDSLLDFQSSSKLSYIADEFDSPYAAASDPAPLHPAAFHRPHHAHGRQYTVHNVEVPGQYARDQAYYQDEAPQRRAMVPIPFQAAAEKKQRIAVMQPQQLAPARPDSPQLSYHVMEHSEDGTEDAEDSDATMHAINSPGAASPTSPHHSSADAADIPAARPAAALRRVSSKLSAGGSSSARTPQARLRLVIKQQLPRVRPSPVAVAAAAAAAATAAAAGSRRPRRAAALRSLAGASLVETYEEGEEEAQQQPALDDDDVYWEEEEYEEEGASPVSSRPAPAPAAVLLPPPGKKKHNPWSQEETEALIEGVRLVGIGKWAEIKKLPLPGVAGMLANRSAVDLKDKWRNLSRVARLPKSALKSRLAKGGSDTPLELVLAVKELLDTSTQREWR